VGSLTPPSPGGAAARGPRDLSAFVVVGALALFFATQYGDALSMAFINDDYIFLDKTRAASFVSLWAPRALAFHWYRPWSRELHYWVLQHLFGTRETPFHVASWLLALAALGGYYALARRLAGATVAVIAVVGTAALAAWGVPLVWIAGVQDLWMLVFALAFLLAVSAGSRALASGALILALLSKEAAAMLPLIAVAHRHLVDRKSWGETLRWALPWFAIVGVWAAFHPVLGGRLWRPFEAPLEPGLHPALGSIALRTLGVPFNLDAIPAPESGWARALARAAPGALLLAMLVAWGARARRAPPPAERAARFGLAWAVVGWTPLLMPTLGWHAYYALLGALGAWLALAALLARRPPLAVALVAGLALLRGARADTPSRDWGSEWYQRRAASFIDFMRADLRRKAPAPPPHSRFYFVRVPSNVGFLAGNGPALRVWYGDSTLVGGYYPTFRARAPHDPRGPDRFFRFDSAAGWVGVRAGAEDVVAARRENPRWGVDHQVLAATLASGGAWAEAAAEYEKLAAADSLRVDFAYNAGVCYETLGDTLRAATWYARAAALPGADEEARANARRLARRRPAGAPARDGP